MHNERDCLTKVRQSLFLCNAKYLRPLHPQNNTNTIMEITVDNWGKAEFRAEEYLRKRKKDNAQA